MIKKFTLLLLAMLCVASTNAKVFETQIWTGSLVAGSSDVAEIQVSSFTGLKAGDAIRVYATSASGCSYQIWYGNNKDDDPSYLSAHSDGWGWVNSGSIVYEDVTLTTADVTNLNGKKIFIKNGSMANSTITKVSHFGKVIPSSVSNLLDANWDGSATAKIFSAINSVKMGDEIQFTVSKASAYTWIEFKLTDKNGSVDQFTGDGSEYKGNGDGLTTFTFEFTISTLNDLWMIMNSGFGVKKTGDNAFTLTAVKLLSYSDSYDYTIDIEMNSDGYMTYSNSMNLDFSGTGLTPYYASEATVGTVTLTSTTTTWNWQGYILRGSAGTYSPKVVANANASYPTGNLLKQNIAEGTVKASESGDTNFRYIFAKKKTGDANIGFYKLTADHTLGAHKAYLETTTDIAPASQSRGITLDFGDGTTAILDVMNDKVDTGNVREDGVYYTLQGTRVQNPSKGLYILNGKKVFIK